MRAYQVSGWLSVDFMYKEAFEMNCYAYINGVQVFARDDNDAIDVALHSAEVLVKEGYVKTETDTELYEKGRDVFGSAGWNEDEDIDIVELPECTQMVKLPRVIAPMLPGFIGDREWIGAYEIQLGKEVINNDDIELGE